MSKAIAKSIADLGWSLWGELGIPSVVRNHSDVAIDPEPLVMFSRFLFAGDARLQEQISRWCAVHADRVSASRLHGIHRAVLPDVATCFDELAHELRSHGVPWAGRPSTERRGPPAKALELPTTRPALARVRLRALCGVGARADVLAELLALRGRALVASEIEHLGYTKRSLARILAELADAGLASTRAERNTLAYELSGARQWAELLAATNVAWPPWLKIFELAALAQRLNVHSEKGEAVHRVAAVKMAKEVDALAAGLGLPPLSPTAGRPDAWDVVITWLELQMRALADGTSPAFRAAFDADKAKTKARRPAVVAAR